MEQLINRKCQQLIFLNDDEYDLGRNRTKPLRLSKLPEIFWPFPWDTEKKEGDLHGQALLL